MTKIVKKSLSDSRLTAGRKRRLKKLSRRPDNEINTSDIPELTERFWPGCGGKAGAIKPAQMPCCGMPCWAI
jgi:hypothetical protein